MLYFCIRLEIRWVRLFHFRDLSASAVITGKWQKSKWRDLLLGNRKKLRSRVCWFAIMDFPRSSSEGKTSPLKGKNWSPKWPISENSSRYSSMYREEAFGRDLTSRRVPFFPPFLQNERSDQDVGLQGLNVWAEYRRSSFFCFFFHWRIKFGSLLAVVVGYDRGLLQFFLYQ